MTDRVRHTAGIVAPAAGKRFSKRINRCALRAFLLSQKNCCFYTEVPSPSPQFLVMVVYRKLNLTFDVSYVLC